MSGKAIECVLDEKLLSFLGDELPAEDDAAVARHIETCPDCRSRLDRICDDSELRRMRPPVWHESEDSFHDSITPDLQRQLYRLSPADDAVEPTASWLVDADDSANRLRLKAT